MTEDISQSSAVETEVNAQNPAPNSADKVETQLQTSEQARTEGQGQVDLSEADYRRVKQDILDKGWAAHNTEVAADPEPAPEPEPEPEPDNDGDDVPEHRFKSRKFRPQTDEENVAMDYAKEHGISFVKAVQKLYPTEKTVDPEPETTPEPAPSDGKAALLAEIEEAEAELAEATESLDGKKMGQLTRKLTRLEHSIQTIDQEEKTRAKERKAQAETTQNTWQTDREASTQKVLAQYPDADVKGSALAEEINVVIKKLQTLKDPYLGDADAPERICAIAADNLRLKNIPVTQAKPKENRPAPVQPRTSSPIAGGNARVNHPVDGASSSEDPDKMTHAEWNAFKAKRFGAHTVS